ncbi:MAG: cytochrome c oxidase subunit II [Flavobacteriales bacterium]|nr:cytochrome c oxidase subunit II [Flavobacteriales bacterium]HRH67977.1 cytochrome c oxidase subunit II [Flavobacteriales bacterium]
MTKLLILIVVLLGILAVAQLARVYELTSRLRGKREEEISDGDNRFNGRMLWLFVPVYFAFFLWLVLAYKDKLLPVAASEHGVETDWLLDFNWWILIIVFVITNILLFWFAGKYLHDKNKRAFWQPHNNKLELAWTIAPAAVLAVIIIYGLQSWAKMTSPASPDAAVVELYARQFDWTARYPGADGGLGATDFRLINGTNPLGIVTQESISTRLAELDAEIHRTDSLLEHGILAPSKADELTESVGRMRRNATRIINLRTLMEQDIAEKGQASAYLHGADDIVIKEFHLPVRQEVKLLIRSQDVIHSVYLPHLRSQMNAVPGMTTTIKMVPTITTDSMRMITKNDAFDFILLCNKICGASHYNMQMPLVVTDAKSHEAWMTKAMEKPFQAPPTPAAPAASPADTTQVAPAVVAQAHTTN